MYFNTNNLDAKVRDQNAVNAEANRLAPLLREWLQPWVGQKVLTSQDQLISKLAKTAPAGCLIAVRFGYSIKAEVRQGEATAIIYPGFIEKDILVELFEWKNLRTDFSVDAIVAAADRIQKLEDEIAIIKDNVHPFLT